MKTFFNFINTKILKNKKFLTVCAVFAFLFLCLSATAHATPNLGMAQELFHSWLCCACLVITIISCVVSFIAISGKNTTFLWIMTIFNLLLFGFNNFLKAQLFYMGQFLLLDILISFFNFMPLILFLMCVCGFFNKNYALILIGIFSVFIIIYAVFIREDSFYNQKKLLELEMQTGRTFKKSFEQSEEIDKIESSLFKKKEEIEESIDKNEFHNLGTDKLNKQMALIASVKKNRKDVCEYFISEGADPNMAIRYAAMLGNKEIVKLFIDKGVNIEAKDIYGQTPLHYASGEGNIEVIDFLITKGANVNAKNTDKFTPLHAAAQMGQKDAVALLITKGAGINERDKYGCTPLLYAVRDGHKETAELLILKGADFEIKNKKDFTMLHTAVAFRHKEIANLLINNGADINAKDDEGKTPLDYVQSEEMKKLFYEQSKEIEQLLLSHGAKSGKDLK